MPAASSVDRSESSQRAGAASTASNSLERTRARVETLVQEIAQLSHGQQPPAEFYQAVLVRVASAIGAVGGVAWTQPPGASGWIPLASLDAQQISQLQSPLHAQLLARIASERRPASAAPDQVQTAGATRLPWIMLLVPVLVAGETTVLLEILQRPDVTEGTQAGNLRFIARMAGLAADYELRQRYGALRDRQRQQTGFDEFSLAMHTGLDPRAIARAIVHDGRTWTGCDRLTLLEPHGRRATVLAISGQDGFDRRATVVRLMERLAAQGMLLGEAVWYSGEAESCVPQVAQAADAVLAETQAQAIAVIPLRRGGQPTDEIVGVLLAEQFQANTWSPTLQERVLTVGRHAGVAMGNAEEHQAVPLLPVWRALGRTGVSRLLRRGPRWVAAIGCLAALVWAGMAIPAKLEMHGHGTLEPLRRREIFARLDGVVGEVRVQHGQRVKVGEPLAILRNDELEQRRSALRGEARKTQTNIDGLRATRTTQWSPEERSRHASRLRALEETLVGLEQQAELLDLQAEELEIVSPLAGEVVTWDVERLLKARPVSRGQILMTVADAAGPWRLEAPLPEDRVGPVMAAWQAAQAKGGKLRASFVLATEPDHVYTGEVEAIAGRADLDPQHGNTVMVTLSFDRSQMSAERLRPGAAATVKIDCGEKPIGLVWLHDACNWWHREVAFRWH